jgi:hypothetical protein
MKKPIIAPINAIPAKRVAAFASCSGTFGKTRTLLIERVIAIAARAIHSQSTKGTVGAIAPERFVQINGGTNPICDSIDQSWASRIMLRYGSSDIAAGTPIASAASAVLKSERRMLTTAAATHIASSRNEF